ncbi:MAG: hypothetical protein KDD69_19410, partial [Bdellovibrionales bacterium]|nr:hypothetical protein [Bdellovibrionales bacterium]
RGFGKFGLAADYSPVRFGVAVTTPSFDITGDGEVTSDLTATDILIDGELTSFTGNDRQESLDAEIRSPFSVSFGAEYDIEASGTTLAFSGEYFAERDPYNVMTPENRPFFRPSGIDFGITSRELLQVYASGSDVVNFALAVEQELNEKWTGYLSVRVDQSTHEDLDIEGYDVAALDVDLYHVVLGASYKGERSETAFGLQYSFGSEDDIDQVTDFDSADESNFFGGEDRESELDFNALTLLLGYTYFF